MGKIDLSAIANNKQVHNIREVRFPESYTVGLRAIKPPKKPLTWPHKSNLDCQLLPAIDTLGRFNPFSLELTKKHKQGIELRFAPPSSIENISSLEAQLPVIDLKRSSRFLTNNPEDHGPLPKFDAAFLPSTFSRGTRSWSCPSDALHAEVEKYQHWEYMSTKATRVVRGLSLDGSNLRGEAAQKAAIVGKIDLIQWLPHILKYDHSRTQPHDHTSENTKHEDTRNIGTSKIGNQTGNEETGIQYCLVSPCSRPALLKGNFCSNHAAGKKCEYSNCQNSAVSGGRCISHGGGKRCQVQNCPNSAVTRGLCIGHGGGRRCQRDGCTRSAQSKGFCVAHGGGRKCNSLNCTNIARSGGLCIRHGGGKRCKFEGCGRGVVSRELCMSHGGGRKCQIEGCLKNSKKGGLCGSHILAMASNQIADDSSRQVVCRVVK